MSRHAFNPTPEQREAVEAMIACGDSEAEICTRIINPATGKPISLKMLRKHFAAEIAPRPVKVDLLINNWMTNTILGRGDIKDERLRVQLAMFWTKYRMGPKETVNTSSGPADLRELDKARQRNFEMIQEVAQRLQAIETGEPFEG